MPGATHYVPPMDVSRNDFALAVAQEKAARRTHYRDALAYYKGEHENQLEVIVNADNSTLDDNTPINLVKMTADRTAGFLFPTVPDFVTDSMNVEETDEEIFLRKFFEANGGLETLQKLCLRAFLSGHGFVRVKPADPMQKSGKYPRIVVLDPTAVTVYWRVDDTGDVLWYETRYYVGRVLYVRDFVRMKDGTWKILTYRGQAKENTAEAILYRPTPNGEGGFWLDEIDFSKTDFVLESYADHTSTIPPIIDFAHLVDPDDYYGLGEANQKALQDMVNRINSLRNRIVRENADPVDIITGDDGTDEIINEGNLVSIANPDARVTRLEMKGDMGAITNVLDKLIETYLAIARVVILKGEAKDLQRVTNAAVRTLFLDAISKNTLLQSSYGRALVAVCRLALMLGYKAGMVKSNPEDIEIGIEWGSALPTDLTEIANINALAFAGGYISRETAAGRLNMNWQEEKQRIENEHTWAMEKLAPPETEEGEPPAEEGETPVNKAE